jgi:hypothetical protein
LKILRRRDIPRCFFHFILEGLSPGQTHIYYSRQNEFPFGFLVGLLSKKENYGFFCLFLFLFATLKFNKTHVEITWAKHLSIFLMDHQKSCFYFGNQ